MKKKTIIICAVILLLVIAFFPFKTVGMKNKDGVISQIKSLTYCIQKIHREVPAEEQDYELVKPYEDGIVIKILGIEVYNDVPNLSKPVEAGIDPEEETKKELSIETLKEEYPEYFKLATFKGVEVYVWEMAEDLIECTALPGTNRIKNDEEILNATKHWVTLTEMKEILKYNGIPFDKVLVIPFDNPISSYKTEDEYALLKKAKRLLEYDINIENNELPIEE